jgi:hypothetical protein
MFSFSKKTKGFFIDINAQTALIARTSSPEAPLAIEEMKEIPIGNDPAVQAAVKEMVGKKSSSGYMHARCSIYPPRRFVRRFTLDLKRVKEPGYLMEICSQQFRMETEKFAIVVLNSADGTDYEVEVSKVITQKEVVFVGGNNSELLAAQDRLLTLGVFPEGLELGTLSALGSLVDYHAFAQLKAPTLLLEIDADSTQSFIITANGLDATRSIPHGLDAMIPVVQKELNLKDEESARKLFFSNTFDFTNMGVLLIKKLLKELQSLIGFYEVQTGQSIGQVLCTLLPPKLGWLSNTIAKELSVSVLRLDLADWLKSHQITFANPSASSNLVPRWLGLFSLMVYYDAVAATKK